jgi:hypothetical protein
MFDQDSGSRYLGSTNANARGKPSAVNLACGTAALDTGTTSPEDG